MMDFDLIVIGGGHAGIEAALAAARMGMRTQLVTQNLDCIGKLSCNPAVGGLSKGNLVREIDALGGEMGRLIDASRIQYRILNRSRGPAVQAPRAQADKQLYAQLAKQTLELQPGLSIFQDEVVDLMVEEGWRADAGERIGRVRGVRTARGHALSAAAVVLTTGTFMEARVFIGDYCASAGRLGEPAAVGLGTALRRLGFSVGRLKTGTPARVLRSSIDFSRLEVQAGDERPEAFSFSADAATSRPELPCWITYTNEETHAVIRENIHRSPLYGGKIIGVGPRYCPSIEDKVMRFPQRDRHQVFIEPEGLSTEEMYLNGVSSSLPEDVQVRFLRTLPGMHAVVVTRPGYAVEYDYMDPTQLCSSLESKRLAGLFVAGQTNGTSGYEEAACQGLMAGINAALSVQDRPPLILSRSTAYIGVLIDDLVTLGTREPYRMFTSRAEYRLNLRHDTADRRLTHLGRGVGLQAEDAVRRLERKLEAVAEIKKLLGERRVPTMSRHPSAAEGSSETAPALACHAGESLLVALRDPAVHLDDLMRLAPELAAHPPELLRQAELDVRYEGYVAKQNRQVERFKKMEEAKIPSGFDYDAAHGLSSEGRQKLKTVRPLSLGQASRIPGLRVSDIAVLGLLIRRRRS